MGRMFLCLFLLVLVPVSRLEKEGQTRHMEKKARVGLSVKEAEVDKSLVKGGSIWHTVTGPGGLRPALMMEVLICVAVTGEH